MNYKTIIPIFVSVAACFLCIFISRRNANSTEVITENLKFCESVLEYNDGLLIANFGGDELQPINSNGLGYINYYVDGEMSTLIPADGTLNAPKGMLVIDEKLYVADVNKVVVYNLADLSTKPHILQFPQGEVFVNHLIQVGNTVLTSVTNTGNIYNFNIDDNSMPIDSTLSHYTSIVGANGMLYNNSTLYVASYPADGVTSAQNQIYRITDFAKPQPEAITNKPGHYDGLALVGSDLYFTDWQEKALGKLNLESSELTMLPNETPIDGPAEIDLYGERIVVPDLVNSMVYIFNLEK